MRHTLKSKRKSLGIFGKVFLYTVLILALAGGSMYALFSNQIKTSVLITQQRKAAQDFGPLLAQINKSEEEIIAFAKDFHRRNSSLNFRFEAADGTVLYETEGFKLQEKFDGPMDFDEGVRHRIGGAYRQEFALPGPRAGNERTFQFAVPHSVGGHTLFLASAESGVTLYISDLLNPSSVYGAILAQAAWIIGLIFLAGLLAALLFARRIARPIQLLSADTRKMSLLEPVDAPKPRGDEIGQLSKDVYGMYSELKATISQLESEISRVKAMEENQRYFFSAASHELKTPVAALSAILEGMVEGVVAPEEAPAYLHECMKLLGEQNKLVSEILEIVKLSGEMPAIEAEPVQLAPCVAGVLEQIMPLTEAKRQRVTVCVPPDVTCGLNGRLFTRALSNILLNAAQNSPDGAEIRVTAAQNGERVLLSVWNSGARIPDDVLPKLFEPFYRTDEARTSGAGHSGLGLTIVKKALDFMEIGFEMVNEDGGILFRMDIP
ncbi:MAG: HAMP domain-containing histidine kinase [Oscillospiraceae bacterium]|nr:HAMP domain-containing histidine kinase [Oscillospiraceae bacterium]